MKGDGGESSASSGTGGHALGEVRSELRRLGYLDHKVERFLLQDALRRSPPWRALALLGLKVGVLIGLPVAAALALALAAVNGHLRHSPFDLLPLFVHLAVPAVLLLGLAFLAISGLLAAVVRLTHARRIEALSFAFALLASALSVAVALRLGAASELAEELPGWLSLALALTVPALAWMVFRVSHGGLLSLSIRLTESIPEPRLASYGRAWLGVLLVVSFLVMVPAALEVRRSGEAERPPSLPESSGDRVLVVGIDGVLPQELDFLTAAGELPALARLSSAAGGGVLARYERPPVEPITFWASVATGLPASEHGLESLDTYRPAGMERPLRRSGWLRHWWRRMQPVGLAEHRPLLAGQRRAWAFWELATRGGAPALVVDWWGTFPAPETPGRLIAHGGYQLLVGGDGVGVVPPEGSLPEVAARAASGSAPPASLLAGLRRVLGEAEADDLAWRALSPDVFYRDEFKLGLEAGASAPRVSALYLPGLDIAAASAELGSVAFGELVRWQLAAVDGLLDSVLRLDPEGGRAIDTALVIFDPGRRASDGAAGVGSEGRALVWRRAGCPAAGSPGETVTPEALTSAALRALGLPQSRRMPPPPA
ncbi:MAG: alkaline phosphatase family protein, partial [Acidobacteriota bacterium]